jgi:hypothetical protein
MRNTLGVVAVLSVAAALQASSARALPIAASGMVSATPNVTLVWDNCGVGRHRTDWGQCVSNFAHGAGVRGCPPGFHLGYQVHACVRNH